VKAKSHLLKHEVPETVDSVHHFGTDDKKEITRRVAAMGQRQLQVSMREDMTPLTVVARSGGSEGAVPRQQPQKVACSLY